ncbi:2-dehydropantoate 2-reductase [Moritella sp. 24]|uniref:ketopantoate reductase family protein n=1 Tax=Moritella sp. 24 TaxID=2746230 RepID=UPI001BA64699|nr:2-dehydropantoate 2-reductase [Moritella sp. 24]QUM75326.1 2-dehydropantoate 2-reductase [Moritella sp. 24]
MANWNILGAGAIGHFFAEKLLKSGQHAAFVLRPESNAHIRTFNFESLDGGYTSNTIMAQDKLTPKCDFLLVTLKAQDVLPALTLLQSQIDKHCCIVLLHNGMGTAEQTEKLFPRNAIMVGTTSNGVLKVSDNHVRHTGAGVTWFGAFNNQAKRYKDIASQLLALEECDWCDDIREKLWLKLVINCAINPLTAIHQCKNGELTNPTLHPQVVNVVKELALVCEKARLPWSYTELQAQVDNVIARTAENCSSMHQDRHFNRQTEIDYITGYVLKVANAYCIPVPSNQTLYEQIKQQETELA